MPAPLIAEPSPGQDLLREWRVRSLYSPYFFVKSILKHPDMIPEVHGHDLMAILRRMRDGIRHQAIEFPRGWLKSSTFTMGLSLWLVLPKDPNDKDYAVSKLGYAEEEWDWREALRDQDYTQLIVFETQTNAARKMAEVREHFESNQIFRAMFPEIAHTGKEPSWNNECIIIRRIGRNKFVKEGTFEAKGVGNALQSTHFDIIWMDDIVGEEAINSELTMEKTKEYYRRLVGVEMPGGRTWHFMVANRWNFNDVNSLARTEVDSEGTPFWSFYTRSAIKLNDAGGIEYDDEGNWIPVWPHMYSLKVLKDKLARIGEADFWAHYLNMPRPPGEREIESGKIHRYKVHRSLEIECSCGARHAPDSLNRYLLFDPYNAKGNTRSKSAPALAVVGLAHDKHVFLLEAFQKKCTQGQLIEKCFELNDRWKVLKFVYEDVGAQNMWELVLRKEQQSKEFKDAKHKPIRSISAVGVKNKPLDVRVRDYLVPVLEGRPGVGTFSTREGHTLIFDMLDTFPHSVPGHDYDLLSALAMGPLIWQFPYAQEEEMRFQIEEDDYLENFNEPYSRIAS